MSKKLILVTGKPGSGKSTASEQAAAQLDGYYFSIGNELRAIGLHDKPSQYSDELKALAPELEQHKPVPPHLAVNVFEECIRQTDSGLIIVDGYPQYPDRLPHFYGSLKNAGVTLLGLAGIEVSDKTARQRMAERRDRSANVAEDEVYFDNRLASYYKNMAPTVATLTQTHELRVIDGEQPIKFVVEALAAAIRDYVTAA